MNKTQVLVTSYWPLLESWKKGLLVPMSEAEEFLESLDRDYPSGQARACAWMAEQDGSISPVLVLEQAQDLHEHLFWWSEGQPEGWFALHVVRHPTTPNGYAVVLIPNARASVSRFRKNTTVEVPDDAEFIVPFRPLFYVGEGNTFITNMSRLGSSTTLYLTDRVPPKEESDLLTVGTFAVHTDGDQPFFHQMWELFTPSTTEETR